MAALRVADLAVFVVSAVEGVEVQTETMWKAAAALGLPRMIFVNKLDRERASFERTLEQLQDAFGAGIAPLELPIGEETEFRGVADLLSDTAITYEAGDPDAGAHPRRHGGSGALGPRQPGRGHRGRRRRPDGALPRGRHPDGRELEETLALGVASGQVFPVVCGSATRRSPSTGWPLHLRDRPLAPRPARRSR